ncbi:MAG: cobyrinate a,c-diamide synthase [Desulfosoma sp.]
MLHNTPRLLIAALRGGAGKTLVSTGLAAALTRGKGLRVVPFKKGPDYIDAGWLSCAASSPCYNLDPYLMTPKKILQSLVHRARGADVALIEGNRGLYDGVDARGTCSSAELAKLLKAPVVLVLDVTKVTRTAAAMVLGCQRLDTQVNVAGVVLNRVAGSRHERVVAESIRRDCGVPVLGVLPKDVGIMFPERHMGLLPVQEHLCLQDTLERLSECMLRYVDVDGILDVARTAEPLGQPAEALPQGLSRGFFEPVRIGVIQDRVFQFYYPDNLEALQVAGAQLVFMDSTTTPVLPDVDALYIGGGFPETHLSLLVANVTFRKSVQEAVENGLPVYAECGGLMYLSQGIQTAQGLYPMVGIFPFSVLMGTKPQGHGYTVLESIRETPFFPEGIELKGHEFHYSRVVDVHGLVECAFRVKKGFGVLEGRDGVCYKNVLATYSHLHALGCEAWAQGMVQAARRYRASREGGVMQDCLARSLIGQSPV